MPRDAAFDDWLRLWGDATGMPDLALGPDGSCAFSVSGKCEIVLEVSDQDSTLYLYAPMFQLDGDDANTGTAALEQLLKLNYSGRETNGAWFAFDQRDQQILLCATLPRQLLDEGSFIAVLRDYVDTAFGWWCHFNEAATADAEDQSSEPGLPPSPGLRV